MKVTAKWYPSFFTYKGGSPLGLARMLCLFNTVHEYAWWISYIRTHHMLAFPSSGFTRYESVWAGYGPVNMPYKRKLIEMAYPKYYVWLELTFVPKDQVSKIQTPAKLKTEVRYCRSQWRARKSISILSSIKKKEYLLDISSPGIIPEANN